MPEPNIFQCRDGCVQLRESEDPKKLLGACVPLMLLPDSVHCRYSKLMAAEVPELGCKAIFMIQQVGEKPRTSSHGLFFWTWLVLHF